MSYRSIFYLLTFLVSILGFGFFFTHSETASPSPTEIAPLQKDPAFKKDRKAWMEQMHRAAPGTDWRAMDNQVRQEKAKRRFKQVRQRQLQRGGQVLDTVANGQVAGHWREIGSNNQAGRTIFADYDPATNEVFVASEGGSIWQGNIFGSNWTVKNDLMRISGINSLKIIYHGGQRRLLVSQSNTRNGRHLYSEDDGLTWTVSSGFDTAYTWGGIRRTIVTTLLGQPQIYTLIEEWDPVDWEGTMAVYASSDGGTSFQRIRVFKRSFFRENSRNKIDLWAGDGEVYLLIKNILYKINGTSLTTVAPLPVTSTSFDNILLTGAQLGGKTYLYAAFRYNQANSATVLRSSNGGVSWTQGGNVNSWVFRQNSFACSQKDPKKVFIGQLNVFRSTDSAASFTQLNNWADYYPAPDKNLHADIPSITPFQRANGGESWFINTDGGLYISHDDLQSVTNISLSGLNVSQYYDTYTSPKWPENLHMGSQDQGYQRDLVDKHDGIRDFEQVISGDYGHYVSGDSGKSLWINYPGFSAYYPNANSNSSNAVNRDFDWVGNNNLWLPPMVADPEMPTRSYLGGGNISNDPSKRSGSFIIQQDIQGNINTPTQLPFDFSKNGNATISAIAISAVDPNFWYVCTDNGDFYYSPDKGANWNETPSFQSPGSHYFYGNTILTSPLTASRVYVAGSGYNGAPVYASDTYGTTFQPMSNGLPNSLVYDIACNKDESLLFAATEVGPYIFVAADSQWYEMEALSAPDQIYWSVEYVEALNIARFGSHGRGVWDYVICDQHAPALSADFTVFGNGPTYSFTNNAQGAHFNEWDFGDGNTTTATSPFHAYTRSGNYTVRLIASNYCSADTFTTKINWISASIADELEKQQFSLSPNPSQGKFTLTHIGNEHHKELTVRVISLQGNTVFRQTFAQFGTQQTLEFSTLPSGIYLVEVVDQETLGKEVLRWVKR